MAGKFLSPEEIAERLSVTPKAVREWLRSNELVGAKLGKVWRVRGEDLNAFIEARLNINNSKEV